MCQLCETGELGAAGFGVVTRPAEQLAGIAWAGSFADARAGAVRALLSGVQARVGQGNGLWASPIIALSWNDRPDGFCSFVGIAAEEADPAMAFDTRLALPSTTCATAWHAAGDGDVVRHYGRMIEWIASLGHTRDTGSYHHREEYPRDADFDAAPELRLMIPID
ncbi:GyrI-like domain-containing protein [Mesorhizobium xinjiangense]|uniref:GyrI-like domain-containing protein n=1 Tax=Mesorhizobium xinjiangense TaxID=2678685 RepID=UPI0012EDBEB8|nr:GyrI-like domain-containing protein [Mesorhizobium xinjiangense]